MTYPYVAGAVLLAADLNTDFASKSDTAPAINAQTGTTYTFVLADATAGKTITASNASASTYTVPPQSSVAFSAGALLRVTNLGAGVVTFAGDVGVTVTNTQGTLRQFETATLIRTGSDAWTVTKFGDAGLVRIATATAAAGSSITFNDVFSTNYRRYLLMISGTASAATGLLARLRVSGADNTSSNYAFGGTFVSDTAGPTRDYSSTTQWAISSANTTTFSSVATIVDPFLSSPTEFHSDFTAAGATSTYGVYSGWFNGSTSFTGLTIYPLSGTITAQAAIYAYAD
jgi:hypothetical protein